MKNDNAALYICISIGIGLLALNLYILTRFGIAVGRGFIEAFHYYRWVFAEWRKDRKAARCD